MKLTEAERAKLAAAIKHFEALQKRYTRQHNGTACEHVKMALIGLARLTQEPEVVRCRDCFIRPMCVRNISENDNGFCSYGQRRMDADAPERAGDGLKVKYRVFKVKDGTPVENCFVLRPEEDPAAFSALMAYAKNTENDALKDDLVNWGVAIIKREQEAARAALEGGQR